MSIASDIPLIYDTRGKMTLEGWMDSYAQSKKLKKKNNFAG